MREIGFSLERAEQAQENTATDAMMALPLWS
jgi:hypothetical protein